MFLTVQLYRPKSSSSLREISSRLFTTSWPATGPLMNRTENSILLPLSDADTWLKMEKLLFRSFKSPWGGILRVKCVIGEGLAIFTPLQRGVTLLLSWVPEESSAVQFHRGSHGPPESGQVSIRFKLWGFGAMGLCVKTFHCYLCSLRKLQTIETFMCTARYSLRLLPEGTLKQNASLQV